MTLRDINNYGTWECPDKDCNYLRPLTAMDVDPHRPPDKDKLCPLCGGVLTKNEIHWGPEGPPNHEFPEDLPLFPGEIDN